MLNPSYLIQSRHSIFYFRYPLGNKRVSVSLQTRCPKEALRLAKFLECHSAIIIKRMEREGMNHADIMAILKNFYAEMLEREKAKIDADGPLPKEKVTRIQDSLKQWGEVIEAGEDDIMGLLGVEYDKLEDDPTHSDLQSVMEHNGLTFAPDSKEYPAITLLSSIIEETGDGSLSGLRKFLQRCSNGKSPAARDMKELGIRYSASKGGRGNTGKFVKRGK